MDKLSTPFRYMLSGFITAGVFGVIAYFVLRPMEWRPQLLSLLVHAFISFTQYLGTNGPGWIISVVGSSVFTIIATIALVGFVRGSVAMRQHWIETAAIALLALIGQIVLLYGPIYLRTVTRTVYDDHQELVSTTKKDKDIISDLKNQPKPVCPTGKPCVCPPGKPCEATEETPKCWISNYHYRMTDEKLTWVTVALIYCNHDLVPKQENPLNIGLQFDKNIRTTKGFQMPGVLDMNEAVYVQQKVDGKRYVASMTMGYIPAYKILAIGVLGDGKEGYPTVIEGGIAQAKP